MTIVNTNINSLIGINNLRLTNASMQTTLQRLSSGLQINVAADNPSGLAMAVGMEAQIGGLQSATQNAEDGINLIHTADGALAQTQEILLRMRDLAVRAANEAVLTTADTSRLNDEFTSLKSELSRKAQAVSFNGKVLFSGLFSADGGNGLVLQIGGDNMDSFQLTIDIPNITLSGLGLSCGGTGANISMGGTSALAAISTVQAALDLVSDIRANLGVQERRLEYVIDDLAAAEINITSSKSRVMDADMAVEISEFTRLQILQQSGMAILAQANAQPQGILQLMQ